MLTSWNNYIFYLSVTVLLVFAFLFLWILFALHADQTDSRLDISTGESSSTEFTEVVDITFNLPVIPQVDLHPCFKLGESNSNNCIPSVICPGVQKSGTTFLYYALIRHPSIAASAIKEVNYFQYKSKNPYQKGIETYATNFVGNTSKILVDFSPKYMMVPESAEMIYNTNRNTKFIIILRDPIDRAYSQFQFMNKLLYSSGHINHTLNGPCPKQREEITFKHVISEEYKVLSECGMLHWDHEAPSWLNKVTMPSNCTTWHCYEPENKIQSCHRCFPLSKVHVTPDVSVGNLAHGLYFSHVKHYMKYFPLENFYFIRFEDIEKDGEISVLNNLCKWLGIPTLTKEEWGEFTITNSNDYPPMSQDEHEFLAQFYHIPNQRLNTLLHGNLKWT